MSTRVQGMTIQKEVSNPNSRTSQGDCSLQVEIAPRSTISGIVPLHPVYKRNLSKGEPMVLPSYLRVDAGTMLRVEQVEPDEIPDCHGKYEHGQHLIQINNEDCAAVQRRTMIHEWAHGWLRAKGHTLTEVEEEAVCNMIEGAFVDFYSHNNFCGVRFFQKPDQSVTYIV